MSQPRIADELGFRSSGALWRTINRRAAAGVDEYCAVVLERLDALQSAHGDRFLYDLWGDAVNTASRMESHGIPGQIQITETTRALLDGEFTCTERGVIDVKGKGPTRTWLLDGEAVAIPA